MSLSKEEEESEDKVPLQRFQPLHLIQNTPKGRGVFAAQSIPAGTIIDISPVLPLGPQESKAYIQHTTLNHYTYNWPLPNQKSGAQTQAVVFGLGSMFNHSTLHQNVGWKRDLENNVIVYRALRDIREGEELCISYGAKEYLTFRDVEAEAEAEREEEPEEVLGKIALDDEEEEEEERKS